MIKLNTCTDISHFIKPEQSKTNPVWIIYQPGIPVNKKPSPGGALKATYYKY